MKGSLIFFGLCFTTLVGYTQPAQPAVSIRLSALLFPFTPLLSVECRTIGSVTIQGETNFVHTHGLNLKYYLQTPLAKSYVFVGSAFVKNRLLRQDEESTILPYAGWGYAYIFDQNWVFDGRIGLGPTLNADRNSIYPVVKVGVGKRF